MARRAGSFEPFATHILLYEDWTMTEMVLGIPTIRQQTHATVREYAENLKRYGHEGTTILVSDDAPAGATAVLEAGLEAVAQACPDSALAYLGPEEKARYLDGLEACVPGASALLQPGYGGNRNWLLLATLGRQLLSVDDDVHPYGLFRERARTSRLVLEGEFVGKAEADRCLRVDFDILGAYGAMLGRPVAEVIGAWADRGQPLAVGSHLEDANVDLSLNLANRPLQPASVELVPGNPPPNGRIGIVQTFLSGDPDLDTRELVWAFHQWGDSRILQGKPPVQFVIDTFRPCVLDHDFRLTAAVLGLDNTLGTIPFIPTRLRFEDYLLRLYSQRQAFHVGYCDAVQTHCRAMTSRNNIVRDFVIEGLATIMKTLINAGLETTGPFTFQFEPRPALEDRSLRTLWHHLVEPLTQQTGTGAGRRSPYWNFYKALVREEALDLTDPGPFVACHRQRLLVAYRELRQAMALWPLILDHARRVPVLPRFMQAPHRAYSRVS
jgi:hypothetical protein